MAAGRTRRRVGFAIWSMAVVVLACAAPCANAGPFDALLTGHDWRPAPALPVPLFQLPYRDPFFGTTITRITDPAQFPNEKRIRHYYSKANPFNADDSRAIFFGSDGAVFVYDTSRWSPIKVLQIRDGEPEIQWDPVDPDVLYHLDVPEGAKAARAIYRRSVRTDTAVMLHDFPEYDVVRGKLEGNLDKSGRYYAMVGRKGRRFEAFVYDLRENRVGPRLEVTEAMVDDWISMSATGRYVVMMGKDRSRVYDREMHLLHELPRGSFGHADLCMRADGSDVMVYDGADHQLDHNRNINMADLATGDVTKVVRIGWGTTPHVSCRNLDLPGWALVSTQGPDRKYPNHDFEIFWVKLDGSGEVRRLAHHHSSREDGGYFAEQHAVSNRRGTWVIFASNWDGTAPIADYLVELPSKPPSAASRR